MKNIYNIVLFLGSILLLASCITNKRKAYLQVDDKPYPSVAFQQYKLSVNDEVIYYLMTTSQETQFLYNSNQSSSVASQNSQTYRIYEDGCVVLPTIGKVKIVGQTIKEAEKLITEKFKTIAVDAEVKLALANNYFYVQGDGGKGQFYLYKEDLNIFQALAMAGDISSMGDKKNVKIIRRGSDGIDHVNAFDLRKESIIGSEYYYIRPNDVIYIPTNPNSFFRIESVSNFVSLVITPLSLVVMALTLFK